MWNLPVNKVLVVNILDPADHLVGQYQNRLHGEPPGAEVEQVLEGPRCIVPFLSVPQDVGDTHSALIIQLRY